MNLKGAIKISSSQPKTKKPLTNQQKLDTLKAKSPHVQTLLNKLGLDENLEL